MGWFLNLLSASPFPLYIRPRLEQIFPLMSLRFLHCIHCGIAIRFRLSAFASAHQIPLHSLLFLPRPQNSFPRIHSILDFPALLLLAHPFGDQLSARCLQSDVPPFCQNYPFFVLWRHAYVSQDVLPLSSLSLRLSSPYIPLPLTGYRGELSLPIHQTYNWLLTVIFLLSHL